MAHMYFYCLHRNQVQIQLQLAMKREREENQYREVTRSGDLEKRREKETVIQWRYREIILHPSPSLKDPPMEKKCERRSIHP